MIGTPVGGRSEELESWLFSDESAIKAALSSPKTPKRIADVKAVASPKEALGKIIYAIGQKRYVNTVHNKRIARFASLPTSEDARRFQAWINSYPSQYLGGETILQPCGLFGTEKSF